jgi:Spy/CpxP family protein refolding chaperone
MSSLITIGLLIIGLIPAGQPVASADQRRTSVQQTNKRVAHLAKRYKLTAEQQTRIRSILQDDQQQTQSIDSDDSLSRKQKQARIKDLRQADLQRFEAVLSDQQRQKFEADQQERLAWMTSSQPNSGPAINGQGP